MTESTPQRSAIIRKTITEINVFVLTVVYSWLAVGLFIFLIGGLES